MKDYLASLGDREGEAKTQTIAEGLIKIMKDYLASLGDPGEGELIPKPLPALRAWHFYARHSPKQA
jgi:hypothetical protein